MHYPAGLLAKSTTCLVLALVFGLVSISAADELRPAGVLGNSGGEGETLVHDFDRTIKPLLVKYCHSCHNAKENKGELNLAAFATADDLAADAERLEGMLDAVSEAFMPPREANQQLSDAQRKTLVEWFRERLHRIAMLQAGDPGMVVVRRLTNAELNYTLTDLTGFAHDWTKDFPHDSSGGEGFSNTGQTLQMSASQIEKYLALAQRLADHMLMLPGSGPVFLETPVNTLTEVENARMALARLDEFCRSKQLTYTDVTPREQITSYAYPDYKPNSNSGYGHMSGYKRFSNEIPGAVFTFLGSTHRLFYRTEKLNPTPFSFMIHRGRIPSDLNAADLATWENLWYDLRYTTGYARPAKISLLHRWLSHRDYRLGDNPALEQAMKKWKVGNGSSPKAHKRHSLDPDFDLSFTVIAFAEYIRDIRAFTSEELRVFANIQRSRDGESRTLMIPNHDAFDAFIHRSFNDQQIERLWQVACDPESKLAKRLGSVPSKQMQDEWRSWTEQHRQWQAKVLPASHKSLCQFAERAWRRPLEDAERASVREQLTGAIDQGQNLQEAAREPLLRVFLSPHFLYRMEMGENERDEGQEGIRTLDDYELANRLSYFLWSSLPDRQLIEAARRGELSQPEKLVEQAHRMLRDPRSRRFSLEFFGQWLGFYRFSDFDRPDAERFPEFDAELRRQMYNEAIDFCTDLVANDRDIRLLLAADYAFLPRRLAQHYGLPSKPNEHLWSKFDQHGDPQRLVTAPRISLASTSRRGVLGWGAMLTETSHPLRTSPVLRGNWILDDLLGIPTPPPPNSVPELPEDEKNARGLSVAQLLAKHRQDKACSVCHDRIDPFGLALENFDPIGRFRKRDLNGTLFEVNAKLHDGTALQGVEGLNGYLQQDKQRTLFTRRLSRKMLGYALGREILPGDIPLLDAIHTKLNSNNFRISVVIESIITSSQFRNSRHERHINPNVKKEPR